ncbi:MAG TPA: RNA polymerase sigma-70 factor [Prolixibacteraceae bacterium]|nr:RNA polymerase sigma-70 factor [Prolixibacteraceae bacterium]HPS12014.1 RNA polymerase sigma-70 factor [Prolixibacteraceae bacterium]
MEETYKGTDWFKEIFDVHYDYIRNYLYYLSGDIDLAEDIAQDVFLKLWENRDKVNDVTVKPLLFRIAKNMFLNSYKRKVLDLKFVNNRPENIENESPQYLLELKEFDVRLQRAISNLPEQCRTFFLMNRIDDMKYQDIANNFGISVKAVEKQISKALKILRSQFEHRM